MKADDLRLLFAPSDGLSWVERGLIFRSPPEGIDESRTPRGLAGRGRSDAGVAVRNIRDGDPSSAPLAAGPLSACRRLCRRRRVSVRVRPPRVGDRHPHANPPHPGSVRGRERGGTFDARSGQVTGDVPLLHVRTTFIPSDGIHEQSKWSPRRPPPLTFPSNRPLPCTSSNHPVVKFPDDESCTPRTPLPGALASPVSSKIETFALSRSRFSTTTATTTTAEIPVKDPWRIIFARATSTFHH